MLHKQELAYPSHFFLAALKNKESLLSECFKQTENAYDSLTNYYNKLNELEKSKISGKEISQQIISQTLIKEMEYLREYFIYFDGKNKTPGL